MRRPPLFAALVLALAACDAPGDHALSGEWRAQIDTIGDTVVVRTLSGSEWGAAGLVAEVRIGALEGEDHEMLGDVAGLAVGPDGDIYLYDRQVPALRRYAADGRYLGTLGRRGGGPGEYENSDGGLVVLRDGRVVLRDPGNARFSVWGPDDGFLESWPARGGTFTATPIFPVRDGGFHNPVFGAGLPTRLVRHGPDGAAGDTVPPPDRGVETPTLSAQGEGISYLMSVPFAPRALWTLHPDGYFVSAVSDRYVVDLLRRGEPVLRIGRDDEPVPVAREERAAEEEAMRRRMRQADASWRWDGPPIPSTKPFMQALFAGEDGRIWVHLHRPGERDPEEGRSMDPGAPPPLPTFSEPVVFDVFEDDGRYLGRVEAPEGFSTFPRPIFRGEHVWSTERDEMGVQYVVRYRIGTGGPD